MAPAACWCRSSADGFNLHGVDFSAAMLASCEARLAARAIKAPLFRQDLTQLNLPFRYTAAFVAAGSFQLITDPAAAASALQRIRAHLVDPGLLLMDMFVPSESAQRLGAPLVEVRTVKLADGTQIALRSESTVWADARMSRIENRYAHRRGAARIAEEHETLSLTWYSPEEIAALLADAGFRDVTTGESPRDDGEERTYLACPRAPRGTATCTRPPRSGCGSTARIRGSPVLRTTRAPRPSAPACRA